VARVGGTGGADATVEIAFDGDGVATVTLVGEIDMSNVDALADQLEPAVEKAPPQIVFDMGALEFMDSSGIALLLRTAARVPDIRLRNPTAIVRRLITSTGLTDTLPIEP
jgi:anti-anti-sigma factor